MKKIVFLLSLLVVSFCSFSQVARTHTMSKNSQAADYTYFAFPVQSTVDYMTGYVNTTGLTYTVTLNKDVPCNVIWYLELDSTKAASGTDSINVDVKINYKHFGDQASYTLSKTIAVDLDANGDYKAVVADSSYLMPTNFTAGGDNVSLLKSDFANVVQLSITQTSGAGVGKLNDKVIVKKVYCRVKLR